MFRNKLRAVQYALAEDLDPTDEEQFRRLVQWLENQRIRLYTIQERQALLNAGDGWPKALADYLQRLGCPLAADADRGCLADWLLGHAVQLLAQDCREHPEVIERLAGELRATEANADRPLGHLDLRDPQFKSGVDRLADLLRIAAHPDPFVTLQAISILVKQRLLDVELAKVQGEQGKQSSLDSLELGFDAQDATVNRAARILRLLHVHELRELQTRINATIVAIQAITADPKTDERLGKVGF